MHSLLTWKSGKISPKTAIKALICFADGSTRAAKWGWDTRNPACRWMCDDGAGFSEAPAYWAELPHGLPCAGELPALEVIDPMAQVMEISSTYQGGDKWNRESVLAMGDFLKKLSDYCYKEGRNMEAAPKQDEREPEMSQE